MGTSSSTQEGTVGNLPSALGTGYGTFTVAALPAGTSSDYAYSSTVAKAGSTSGRVNSTTQAAVHTCTSVSTVTYFRGYYYLSAALANSTMLFGVLGGGYTDSLQIGIGTTGTLWTSRGSSTLNSVPSGYVSAAGVVPIGSWFRVEGLIDNTNSNRKVRARIYRATDPGGCESASAGLDSGDNSDTVSMSVNDVRIGAQAFIGGGWASICSSSQYLYMDDLAVSDAGWIGPTGTPSTPRGLGITRY